MSNVLSKEASMNNQDKLDKCEVERKYLHKVYEESKAEVKQLKQFINSLMTEDQKDICNGEAMELGEQTLQTPKDWIDRIRMFLEERDSLEQKVEDLEEDADDDWLSVFSVLSDAGYAPTSRGQVVTSIKDLKEELEAEKFYSQQLKYCDYEGYCEMVCENKLIKEFEDLKNELGEKTEENKALNKELEYEADTSFADLTDEIKKLEQEVQYHKETAEVAVGLANSIKEDYDKLKEDTISRADHQKVVDILNAEAEMYKVKFMEATGKLK